MRCDVILGVQWGDEGKAKIIDSIAGNYDIIARFQGGSNAGHTVILGSDKYVFHLVPSGLLYPQTIGILGNGVVVNLRKLVEEIQELRKKNIVFENRFFISDRAFLVLPIHIELDTARENYSANNIGTTKQGIGPAYMDKVARLGLRLGDLKDKEYVRSVLEKNLLEKKVLMEHLYKSTVPSVDMVMKELYVYYEEIISYIIDTTYYLNDALKNGKRVLLEGAQGIGLDLDFGTYPFVTSSNASTAGVMSGTGINFRYLEDVIGIVKVYCTRVGKGLFPSKMSDEDLDRTRKLGHEYGSTTGRPRDCGWFDAVHVKFAAMISGLSQLAVTKLDVFDTFETIQMCVAYDINGVQVTQFPSIAGELAKVKPVYKTFKGWKTPTTHIRDKKDLPKEALEYLEYMEKATGVPIAYISNGADRESLIRC